MRSHQVIGTGAFGIERSAIARVGELRRPHVRERGAAEQKWRLVSHQLYPNAACPDA